MSMAQKFREFRSNGLMFSIAFGIVLAQPLGALIKLLLGDVIFPPIQALLGGLDFSQMGVRLTDDGFRGQSHILAYGQFIETAFYAVLQVAVIVLLFMLFVPRSRKAEIASPQQDTEQQTS